MAHFLSMILFIGFVVERFGSVFKTEAVASQS
jgi:hypothetical protein